MSFKSKNLVLIIGNGFDLAHEYKTSYKDFANYILEVKIAQEISNHNESIENSIYVKGDFLSKISRNMLFNDNGNFIQRLTAHRIRNEYDKIPQTLKIFTSELKIILKNNFLGKLFDDKYENWFDIENAYFHELISIENSRASRIQKTSEILELNKNLSEIKSILLEYLKTIRTEPMKSVESFFNSLKIGSLENLYVISFNYTITVKNYFENSSKITINYIHGDIESENIIFGYGNDQHVEYKKIKESGIDEYLRFFKTFEYLNNRNYSEIYENALEKFQEYDVSVIGHSLGQTDKTLLKEILNNPKCKKIHLHKRADLKDDLINLKEEFNKNVFSISRIIDNERDLRVKVLNYEDSSFFP